MDDLPETSNFYSCLCTRLTKEQVAELFRPLATKIRKCGWDEFEVFCPWAELVIEGDTPILLHGPVADVLRNAERLFALLRAVGISYSGECYSETGELLREFTWDSPEPGAPADQSRD